MVKVRGKFQGNICTRTSLAKNMNDMTVLIIDKTDVREPTRRESFLAYKLNSFVPRGTNLRNLI